MTFEGTRLRRLRRQADGQGLRLRKMPELHRWHGQCARFLLVDATDRSIVASSIPDLDAVAATLAETELHSMLPEPDKQENLSDHDEVAH